MFKIIWEFVKKYWVKILLGVIGVILTIITFGLFKSRNK